MMEEESKTTEGQFLEEYSQFFLTGVLSGAETVGLLGACVEKQALLIKFSLCD